MFEFYTPRKFDDVYIDLQDVRYGGTIPAVIRGTQNFRDDVYIRFSYGFLRVRETMTRGENAEDHGFDHIFEQVVPPRAIYGFLTLTQACRLFGMTFRGEIPEETDPEAVYTPDLSGDTTFAYARLYSITPKTMRKIARLGKVVWPESRLGQVEYEPDEQESRWIDKEPEELNRDRAWICVSEPNFVKSHSLYYSPSHLGGQKVELCSISGWRDKDVHGVPARSPHLDAEMAKLGRRLKIAGLNALEGDPVLSVYTVEIECQFETGNAAFQQEILLFEEKIRELLPLTKIEKVLLLTGETISIREERVDPEVVSWCNEGPDRWMRTTTLGDATEWYGERPISGGN